MEVPRLRVQLELQLLATATATATQDASRVCDLHHNSPLSSILSSPILVLQALRTSLLEWVGGKQSKTRIRQTSKKSIAII